MYHNCYTIWKSRQTSIIQDINLAYFIIRFVWQVEDFNWNLGKKYWLAISSPRQAILQSLGFLTSSSSLSPPERFSGPWKSPQKVKVQNSLQTNARTSTYSKRFQVKLPTQTPDKHGGTSTCDQHGDLGTHAPVNTLMLYWNNSIHNYVPEPYTPTLTHTGTTLCTVMYQNLVYLLYHTHCNDNMYNNYKPEPVYLFHTRRLYFEHHYVVEPLSHTTITTSFTPLCPEILSNCYAEQYTKRSHLLPQPSSRWVGKNNAQSC